MNQQSNPLQQEAEESALKASFPYCKADNHSFDCTCCAHEEGYIAAASKYAAEAKTWEDAYCNQLDRNKMLEINRDAISEENERLKKENERLSKLVNDAEPALVEWYANKQGWYLHSSGEYYYKLDYPSQWPTPHVKELYEMKDMYHDYITQQKSLTNKTEGE